MRFLLVVFTVATLNQIALANEHDLPRPRTITVSGHSEVSASPDLAIVSIAVETTSAAAGATIEENARRGAKVSSALKGLLGSDDKLTTTGYSLEPRYEVAKPGQATEPKIVGYVARNQVQIETHKIDGVGAMIDAAIAAGGNRVDSLSFSLANRNEQLRVALERAGAEARAQAESIAKALGVKLTQVLQASTSAAPNIQPRFMKASFAAAEARIPTSIEPGSVTVSASLEVTYGIE